MLALQPTFFRSLAVVTVLLAGAAAAAPVKTLWSGSSGGYRWRFTATDITARKGVGPAFSLAKQLYPKGKDLEGLTSYANNVVPLSLVGSMLTFEQNVYWEGGAHPSGAVDYTTVDVSRPGRALELTDLFPDAQVRDALWSDPVVHRVLTKAGVTRKPATAKALAKALEFKKFGPEEGPEYQFLPDFLASFSFHHLEGNRVAVRLKVPWGAELYRFQSTEIGILLPVPERLRGPLQRAAAQREGFLTRSSLRKRFQDNSITLIERGMKG